MLRFASAGASAIRASIGAKNAPVWPVIPPSVRALREYPERIRIPSIFLSEALFAGPRTRLARLAYNLLHALALLRGDVAHDILCVLAGCRRIEIVDVALAPLALGHEDRIIQGRPAGSLQKSEPGGGQAGWYHQDASQILELAAEIEQPFLVRRQRERLEDGRALRKEARLRAPHGGDDALPAARNIIVGGGVGDIDRVHLALRHRERRLVAARIAEHHVAIERQRLAGEGGTVRKAVGGAARRPVELFAE